jgi:hypothetical protein
VIVAQTRHSPVGRGSSWSRELVLMPTYRATPLSGEPELLEPDSCAVEGPHGPARHRLGGGAAAGGRRAPRAYTVLVALDHMDARADGQSWVAPWEGGAAPPMGGLDGCFLTAGT